MNKYPLLPVSAVLADIKSALIHHDHLVLEAPPGAGKSTLVPLSLLNEPWLGEQKIIMLQPRRMAARAVAERMAYMLGERVGLRVGYSVRLEKKVCSDTRIEVVTEGILTRRLQNDPSLEGIGLVIFDEFHERNLQSDLGLALCLQGRMLFRENNHPLKLLVMSATLNGEAVSSLLGEAPLIRSEGQMFPVHAYYSEPSSLRDPIIKVTARTVCRAMAHHQGSILVFLPGQGEIRRVQNELRAILSDAQRQQTAVLPLYGGLSLSEQQKAIIPISEGAAIKRKVVLATDIAETSLTIEGISVVIDSGLKREPVFDPSTGMTRLQTRRLSAASSVQRMGRAGRTAAGDCYRLWSEAQQQQLMPHSTPEISQTDLAPLVLQLLSWGVQDPSELSWIDLPPRGPYAQAEELLIQLGAVLPFDKAESRQLKLTVYGQRMAVMPVHPRLAHMLLCAEKLGLLRMAADLAALLSDRDPLNIGADLSQRLAVLQGSASCPPAHRAWLKRTQQQARNFYQPGEAITDKQAPSMSDDDALGYLIACAYPDRIARVHSSRNACYQLSNGRKVLLAESESLCSSEWLAVAEVGGHSARPGQQGVDRIFAAAMLNPALFDSQLNTLLEEKEIAEWDDQNERFIAENQSLLGVLIVRREKISPIPLEAKRVALLNQIKKQSLGMLSWRNDLRQWRARVILLHNCFSTEEGEENPWPDLSDKGLLDTLDYWLGPFLDNVSSIKALQKLDLLPLLKNLLPWPLPEQLNIQAPVYYAVPSGSSVSIDYLQVPPVLAVKLQEMFGCEQTPAIARGQIKLMVHLLSPAQRPIQVTQDLAGFWRGAYSEVKKEMKGRYPKHPWPDDPLTAVATKYTKSRQVK